MNTQSRLLFGGPTPHRPQAFRYLFQFALLVLLLGACAPSASDQQITTLADQLDASLFTGEYRGSADIGRAAEFTIPAQFTLTYDPEENPPGTQVFRLGGEQLVIALAPEDRENACALWPELCAGDDPNVFTCDIRHAAAFPSRDRFGFLSVDLRVSGACPEAVFSFEAPDLSMIINDENQTMLVFGSGPLAIDFTRAGTSRTAALQIIFSSPFVYQ